MGQPVVTVHDFKRSLAASHSHADAPWWDPVYREAFPALVHHYSVRDDGWAQRGGIDRLIVLRDGTTLKVDEKVRGKDWPDICIEIWSDEERKIPGWAHPSKDLTCDYIAYALVPSQTCYLIPYQVLRRVMQRHGIQWWRLAKAEEQGFQFVCSPNRDGARWWTTKNIAVPVEIVLDALRDCLIVRWPVMP